MRNFLDRMMLAASLAAAWSLLVVSANAQDSDGRRVALIIGNGAYTESAAELLNPANDARAIAGKLAGFGFEVIEAVDLDFRGMRMALREFDRALQGADAAVFFYAGHGMEYQGHNYLFPTDAILETEGDIGLGLIDMDAVLTIMETAVPTRLVFLDACRNNPLARSFRGRLANSRSSVVGRGLAEMDAALGTFIAYATAPGDVAADGDGANSPFTNAILRHIDEPGLDIAQLMRRVRATVSDETRNLQVPWSSSSLRGDFIFNQVANGSSARPTSNAVATQPSAADSLWQALQSSDNADEWRYFAESFPADPRAGLARMRADRMAQVPPAGSPSSRDNGQSPTAVNEEKVASATPRPAPETESSKWDASWFGMSEKYRFGCSNHWAGDDANFGLAGQVTLQNDEADRGAFSTRSLSGDFNINVRKAVAARGPERIGAIVRVKKGVRCRSGGIVGKNGGLYHWDFINKNREARPTSRTESWSGGHGNFKIKVEELRLRSDTVYSICTQFFALNGITGDAFGGFTCAEKSLEPRQLERFFQLAFQ